MGRNTADDSRGVVFAGLRSGSVWGPGSSLQQGRGRFRAGLRPEGSPGGDIAAVSMSGNAVRRLAKASL